MNPPATSQGDQVSTTSESCFGNSCLALINPHLAQIGKSQDSFDGLCELTLSPRDSSDPTPRDSEDGEDKLQRRYKVPKPRIVRNDFRRFYPNMWVNVFNSIDRELMTQHLRTYYAPSVVVLQADLRYDREVHPQEIPMYQESARGLDYLGAFWYAGMNAAPDLVCSLRHTTLKVRSDGTSAIKCAFVLKGTMVATLDDQKQKDVERIARYQKHKESGRTDIRDITFTEAAMVAVAPPAIVQVPGGKANLPSNAKGTSTLNAGTACATTLAVSIKKEPALEDSVPLAGATVNRVKSKANVILKRIEKSQTSLSSESLDSVQEGGSPSMFSCNVSSGASVTSVESAGTISTAGTKPSQLSRKRPHPTEEASSDSEENFLRPVPRHNRTAKQSSQPSVTSPVSDHHDNIAQKNKMEVPRTALSKKARSVLDAAAKMQIDWLSVAESAYEAGVLQPCQPQGAKQHQYHSHLQEQAVPSAAALLAAHVSRNTATEESKDGAVVDAAQGNVPAQSSEKALNSEENTTQAGSACMGSSGNPSITISNDTSETAAVAPVGKKIVMTARIDCVCSLELELNSNSVIVGIAVNYFR